MTITTEAALSHLSAVDLAARTVLAQCAYHFLQDFRDASHRTGARDLAVQTDARCDARAAAFRLIGLRRTVRHLPDLTAMLDKLVVEECPELLTGDPAYPVD